jgi:hypothetical protein
MGVGIKSLIPEIKFIQLIRGELMRVFKVFSMVSGITLQLGTLNLTLIGVGMGGGVVNQNVVEGIQRNKNAFAILAENKRVDIAIVAVVDNIVKTSYKYFTQKFSKIFILYYIDILYNIK